jgi:hypothetical protein
MAHYNIRSVWFGAVRSGMAGLGMAREPMAHSIQHAAG